MDLWTSLRAHFGRDWGTRAYSFHLNADAYMSSPKLTDNPLEMLLLQIQSMNLKRFYVDDLHLNLKWKRVRGHCSCNAISKDIFVLLFFCPFYYWTRAGDTYSQEKVRCQVHFGMAKLLYKKYCILHDIYGLGWRKSRMQIYSIGVEKSSFRPPT